MRVPDFTGVWRAVLADLRKRHLLPVVALLVVAIVAIPVLLSNGAAAPAPTTEAVVPATGSGSLATAVPSVQVQQTTPSHAHLAGAGRDPFVQQPLPHVPTTSRSSAAGTSTAASASRASGDSTSAPAKSGTTTTGTTTATVTTPTSTTPPATPTTTYFTYDVRLTFGPARGPRRRYDSASRFAAIPSAQYATALFLGVKDDGRTAEFLVTRRAPLGGQGTCIPSRSQCQLLTLEPGQAEAFVLPSPTGVETEYVLHYVSVELKTIPKPATGNSAVSKSGQTIIHRFARSLPSLKLNELSYDPYTGLLTRG